MKVGFVQLTCRDVIPAGLARLFRLSAWTVPWMATKTVERISKLFFIYSDENCLSSSPASKHTVSVLEQGALNAFLQGFLGQLFCSRTPVLIWSALVVTPFVNYRGCRIVV